MDLLTHKFLRDKNFFFGHNTGTFKKSFKINQVKQNGEYGDAK